jgi:hypothetical protein
MEVALRSGQMDLYTKVSGKTTRLMGSVASFMLTVMSMRASGVMIRLTVLASTCTLTALSTRACGRKINSTVKAKRLGPMVPNMKAST